MSLRELLYDGLLAYTALEELEEVIHRLNQEHRRRRPIVKGRFSGMFTVNSTTGEIIMATQQLTVGTSFTAPLVFTDTTGAAGKGPVGTISSSDGTVSVSLSADGQSANALMSTANIAATLTWHDPAGVVPDFTVDVTDAVVFVASTGAFGTFVPGTTA